MRITLRSLKHANLQVPTMETIIQGAWARLRIAWLRGGSRWAQWWERLENFVLRGFTIERNRCDDFSPLVCVASYFSFFFLGYQFLRSYKFLTVLSLCTLLRSFSFPSSFISWELLRFLLHKPGSFLQESETMVPGSNLVTPICLCVFYSCFCAAMGQWSCCNRDQLCIIWKA